MKKCDFKPLDSSAFEKFACYAPFFGESCERSWANLQLYNNTYNWQFAELDNRLYIASFEEAYIFFPLGEMVAPEELQKHLLEFAGCCQCEIVCGDVPYNYAGYWNAVSPEFELIDDPGDYDYIYSVDHLCSFQGSCLRKRHNQVRQFERAWENNYHVEVINKQHLSEVYLLAERLSSSYWQDSSGLEEKLALERLVELWNEPALNLSGTVLYAGDILAGFSIYSMLNNDLADVHFEKADRAYPGCGAKVTAVLASHLQERGCRFMNREQDLNEEGLRKAKKALDPDHLYRRLSIKCSE